MKKAALLFLLCFVASASFTQIIRSNNIPQSPNDGEEVNRNEPVVNYKSKSDTAQKSALLGFEHRDDAKDSVYIYFKDFGGIIKKSIDSSINDFDSYYAVPSHYLYLGNNGAAAHPLIFHPNETIGFDPGFHAYDIYQYSIEGTKFFKTTKPFTSLSYQLASGQEQMINVLHTQNPRPNINWGFDFRLINAPGFFVTQSNNHKSYRLFGNYQGKRKRYQANMIIVGNDINASENGGIENADYLSDPNRSYRFSVPVNLGKNASYKNNPFVTTVTTGNVYKNFDFLLRQSYDLGKKDSIIINDSTTDYLFFPKLRLQHTLQTQFESFHFGDIVPDSTIYKNWYNITLPIGTKNFEISEIWKVIKNDFSVIQFPDTKNQAQYFLAGISFENIQGEKETEINHLNNLFVHAEYRNRTRNKLWDMLAQGIMYVNGNNAGDYMASASISRFINKKLGEVKLFFTNENRTPSFVFDNRSAFNLGNNNHFQKEQIVSLGFQSNNAFMKLIFKNHLIVNHTYFTSYEATNQYNRLINLIELSASKKIQLSKKWFWYIDATLQQTDKAAPVKVPFFYTRNRLAFEGTFFKNLSISSGIEARYFTPYHADNYSPVVAQFFPQDSVLINNLPDITAFLHFRIKSFSAYLRFENLNTASFSNGFGWTHNNFAAPLYPTQEFMIRFGIRWWFVN